MSDIVTFRDVLDSVHECMIYEDDQVVFKKDEYWRSWTKEVLAGQRGIKDDCDGFALTIAELLLHFGIPKENVAIAFCEIRDVGYHLICKAFCRDDNKWYIMDCNTDIPVWRDSHEYPVSQYRWESAMYFNKPREWVIDE